MIRLWAFLLLFGIASLGTAAEQGGTRTHVFDELDRLVKENERPRFMFVLQTDQSIDAVAQAVGEADEYDCDQRKPSDLTP